MNITNLESLERKGQDFFARYEKVVDTTKKVAHPVFTNAHSMTDKIGTSRVVKHIVQVPGTRTETEVVPISEEEAKATITAAKVNNMVARVEMLTGDNCWVVRMKA